MPLYVRGDDANSRQFASLHGVQRHMVDANKCKMVFDDNEEEYEEFYDWSKLEGDLQGTVTACMLAAFKASNHWPHIPSYLCFPCVH